MFCFSMTIPIVKDFLGFSFEGATVIRDSNLEQVGFFSDLHRNDSFPNVFFLEVFGAKGVFVDILLDV